MPNIFQRHEFILRTIPTIFSIVIHKLSVRVTVKDINIVKNRARVVTVFEMPNSKGFKMLWRV
jgi:hypothetical protein